MLSPPNPWLALGKTHIHTHTQRERERERERGAVLLAISSSPLSVSVLYACICFLPLHALSLLPSLPPPLPPSARVVARFQPVRRMMCTPLSVSTTLEISPTRRDRVASSNGWKCKIVPEQDKKIKRTGGLSGEGRGGSTSASFLTSVLFSMEIMTTKEHYRVDQDGGCLVYDSPRPHTI